MTQIDAALIFAAERHAGTFRDGDFPLPYLTHVTEVLTNLRVTGGVTDENLLAAACLHDVLEHSATESVEVESRFGPIVTGLVKELTRREPCAEHAASMDKAELWAFRSKLLLEDIQAMSTDAQQVKLADRLSNLHEGFRTKKPKKLARYLEQTREILRIVDRGVNPGLWDAINGLAKS